MNKNILIKKFLIVNFKIKSKNLVLKKKLKLYKRNTFLFCKILAFFQKNY